MVCRGRVASAGTGGSSGGQLAKNLNGAFGDRRRHRAQVIIGAVADGNALNAKAEWITFLAGTGAIVLTFLAGAELDPVVFRAKWKESG